jgi:V/A-type H+-transporting ATPase subunit D
VDRAPTPTRHNLLERRREVCADLERARRAAANARLLALEHLGGIELRRVAATRSVPAEVVFAETKLAGLRVQMAVGRRMELGPDERGYGPVGTDAYADLLAETHERLLSVVVRAADVEAVCHTVVDELTRRVRQVDGLTHRASPDLEADIDYVESHLREREREGHVRQLFLKRRRHDQPRPRPRRRLRRVHRSDSDAGGADGELTDTDAAGGGATGTDE